MSTKEPIFDRVIPIVRVVIGEERGAHIVLTDERQVEIYRTAFEAAWSTWSDKERSAEGAGDTPPTPPVRFERCQRRVVSRAWAEDNAPSIAEKFLDLDPANHDTGVRLDPVAATALLVAAMHEREEALSALERRLIHAKVAAEEAAKAIAPVIIANWGGPREGWADIAIGPKNQPVSPRYFALAYYFGALPE